MLNREKRGVWVYYQARPEAMDAIFNLFDTVDLRTPPGAES